MQYVPPSGSGWQPPGQQYQQQQQYVQPQYVQPQYSSPPPQYIAPGNGQQYVTPCYTNTTAPPAQVQHCNPYSAITDQGTHKMHAGNAKGPTETYVKFNRLMPTNAQINTTFRPMIANGTTYPDQFQGTVTYQDQNGFKLSVRRVDAGNVDNGWGGAPEIDWRALGYPGGSNSSEQKYQPQPQVILVDVSDQGCYACPAGGCAGGAQVVIVPFNKTMPTNANITFQFKPMVFKGVTYPDKFAGNVVKQDAKGFTLSLYRTDTLNGGWGASVQFDWFAKGKISQTSNNNSQQQPSSSPGYVTLTDSGVHNCGSHNGGQLKIFVKFNRQMPIQSTVSTSFFPMTLNGVQYPDSFACNVEKVDTNGFTASVTRIDAGNQGGGWGGNAQLQWTATGSIQNVEDQGTFNCAAGCAGGSKQEYVRFSKPMPSKTTVQVWFGPMIAGGQTYPDQFQGTVVSQDGKGFTVSYNRVDAGNVNGGWGGSATLHYKAVGNYA